MVSGPVPPTPFPAFTSFVTIQSPAEAPIQPSVRSVPQPPNSDSVPLSFSQNNGIDKLEISQQAVQASQFIDSPKSPQRSTTRTGPVDQPANPDPPGFRPDLNAQAPQAEGSTSENAASDALPRSGPIPGRHVDLTI